MRPASLDARGSSRSRAERYAAGGYQTHNADRVGRTWLSRGSPRTVASPNCNFSVRCGTDTRIRRRPAQTRGPGSTTATAAGIGAVSLRTYMYVACRLQEPRLENPEHVSTQEDDEFLLSISPEQKMSMSSSAMREFKKQLQATWHSTLMARVQDGTKRQEHFSCFVCTHGAHELAATLVTMQAASKLETPDGVCPVTAGCHFVLVHTVQLKAVCPHSATQTNQRSKVPVLSW